MSEDLSKIQTTLSRAVSLNAANLCLDEIPSDKDDTNAMVERKQQKEAAGILLKDVPDIEDYMPDDVDLNRGIDEPLRTKTGEPYPSNLGYYNLDFHGTQNALIHASSDREGNSSLIERLLKKGANPNAVAKYSFAQNVTALMVAVCVGGSNVVIELLLSYGADIFLKDSNGNTIIDWAVLGGHPPGIPTPGGFYPTQLNWFNQPLAAVLSKHIKDFSEQYQDAFNSFGKTIPLPICKLIERYRMDFADISLTLSRLPRFKQIHFLNTLSVMAKEYTRDKRKAKIMDKLSDLSEDELDALINSVRKKKVTMVKKTVASEDGERESTVKDFVPAPIVFSRKTAKGVTDSIIGVTTTQTVSTTVANAAIADSTTAAKVVEAVAPSEPITAGAIASIGF